MKLLRCLHVDPELHPHGIKYIKLTSSYLPPILIAPCYLLESQHMLCGYLLWFILFLYAAMCASISLVITDHFIMSQKTKYKVRGGW